MNHDMFVREWPSFPFVKWDANFTKKREFVIVIKWKIDKKNNG